MGRWKEEEDEQGEELGEEGGMEGEGEGGRVREGCDPHNISSLVML